MTKHNPRSLLERAAEMYDFGAALRGPVPANEAAPKPVAVPAPPPDAPVPSPVLVAVEVPKPAPAPEPVRPAIVTAPAPLVDGTEAEISRDMLAAHGFIVPGAQMTALAEEFRLLKRQLLSEVAAAKRQSEEKRRSVLVCSAQPKEGKTFCAINLALSLAGESELEVLLVEADFLKPDTLGRLGIPGGPGFVDALLDPDVDPEILCHPHRRAGPFGPARRRQNQ